jgi:formate-dependent nitrite reductase membrane component NrfD
VPITAYTAVLLVNTAVPVWQGARRTLPPLFVASAVTSAAGLLDLQPQGRSERRVVTAFGTAGKVAELVAMGLVEGELGRRGLGRARACLRRGRAGVLRHGSTLLTLTSLALSLTAGRSRGRRVAAGIAATAGALCLRLAIVAAGSAAARDPRASFEPQRAGLAGSGSGTITGGRVGG